MWQQEPKDIGVAYMSFEMDEKSYKNDMIKTHTREKVKINKIKGSQMKRGRLELKKTLA